MPGITPIQADFSIGEVAPDVQYRSTLEARNRGVRKLTNFVTDSRGPVIRRKGFRFLGEVGIAGDGGGEVEDCVDAQWPIVNDDPIGFHDDLSKNGYNIEIQDNPPDVADDRDKYLSTETHPLYDDSDHSWDCRYTQGGVEGGDGFFGIVKDWTISKWPLPSILAFLPMG